MSFLQQLFGGMTGQQQQPGQSPTLYGPPTQQQAMAPPAQQMDPMRRFLAGLAGGLGGDVRGLSGGAAFARGLGGGITGNMSYEDRMRKEREDREQREFQQRIASLGLGLQQRAADRGDRALDITETNNRERLAVARDRATAGRGNGTNQSLRDEDAIRQGYIQSRLQLYRGSPELQDSTQRAQILREAEEFAERMIQQRRQRLGAGASGSGTPAPYVAPSTAAEDLDEE
jgi:hypothetical protein